MKKHDHEVRSLKSKFEEKEQKVAELESSLKANGNKVTAAAGQLEASTAEAEKVRRENEELTEERNRLKVQAEENHSRFRDLESKLETLRKQHQSLEHHHSLVIQESQENKVERQYLDGRVQDLVRQVEELGKNDVTSNAEVELEEARKCEKKLLEKIANFEQDSAEISRQLDVIVTEKSQLIENLLENSGDKEHIAKELLKVTSSIKSRISEYESAVKDKDDALKSLQASHDKILSEKNILTEKLSQMKKSMRVVETDSQSFKETIAQMELTIMEKEGQVIELKTKCKNFSDISEKLQLELDEKQAEVEKLSAAETDNAEKLKHLADLHNRTQQDMIQMRESLHSAASNVQALSEEKEKLTTENQCLSERIEVETAQLQSEVDQLKKFASEMNAQNACLRENSRDNELLVQFHQEQLVNEKANHAKVVENLNLCLAEAQQRTCGLQSDVESLKLSLEEITNEKRASEDLADHRLSLIHDFKERIETLTNSENDAQRERQFARAELAGRKETEDDFAKQVCKLQQALEDKNSNILKLKAECDSCTASFSELENKYVKACKDLEEKTEEIIELESKLELLQQNIALKTSEISQLSEVPQKSQHVTANELKNAKAEKDLVQSELNENSEKLKLVNNFAEKLKFENQEMARKLNDLRVESQKVAGNLELMQMDMEDKDVEIETLQTVTIPKLEAMLDGKNKEIEELESGKKEMKEQIERLCCEKTSLSAQISDVILERDQLQADSKSLKNAVETLQEINQTLSSEGEKYDESLSAEIRLKDELEASLVECTANVAQQLHEISELKKSLKKLKIDNEELAEEAGELNEKNAELVADLEEKVKELEEKCTQVESLERKVDKLNENLETVQKECGERVERAEEECEEFHSSIKELRKVAGEAQWKVGNLESLYERMSHDNACLRQENESLINDVSTASRTLMDLEDQLDEAERKLEERTENDDVIANLRTEIDSLTIMNGELKETMLKMSEELNAKTCECDELVEECRDVKVRFASLEKSAVSCSDNVAQTACSEEVSKSDADELRQQLVSLGSELEEKAMELSDFKTEHLLLASAQQNILQEKSAEIAALQAQVDELSNQLSKKDCAQNILEQNITDLQTREGVLQQCRDQLESEIQALKKQLATFKFALEKSDLQNQELSKKVVEAESALKDLGESTDNQVTAVKSKYDTLEVGLRNTILEKAELSDILQQKLEKISMLQVQNSEVAEVVEKLSCEKFALEETVQSLLKNKIEQKKEIDQVTSQAGELEMIVEAKEQFICDQALQIQKLLKDLSLSGNEKDEMALECSKLRTDLTEKDAACSKLRAVLINLEERLKEVQTSLQEIIAERDNLKTVVSEKDDLASGLRTNNEQLRDSMKEMSETFAKSEQNLAKRTRLLRQEVGILQEKLTALTNQCQNLEKLLESKDREIGDLRNKLSVSSETNSNLKKEIEQAEELSQKSTDQVESLSAQLRSSHQLVENKSKEVDSLNVELRSARDELAAAMKKAQVTKARCEDAVDCLNARLERVDWELTRKSQLVDRLLQEKKAESALLASMTSELNKERALLNCEKQEHADDVSKYLKKCDAANSELMALKSVVDELKKKDDANSSLIEAERKRVDEILQENFEISSQLQTSVRDNGALYEQINDLTWQLTDYRRDSRCKIEKLQTLSCDRENIATKNTELISQIDQLSEENKHLQCQISEISAKYQKSEMEQQSLKSTLNAMGLSISGLEEKLTVTTLKSASEVSTLESKVKSLNNEIASLESKHQESLVTVSAEMDELKSERSELKEDLKELKKQRKLKNKEIIELQDKLSVTSLKLSELTPKFKHLTATTEQLKTALSSKSSELICARNTVSLKDNELDRLRNELASAQAKHESELEDRNSKITILNEELVKLGMDLKNTIRTLTVAEKSAENQETKINHLEEELSKNKEEHFANQKLMETLIEEKQTLLHKQKEHESVIESFSESMTEAEANLRACHDDYAKQKADFELCLSNQRMEADRWKNKAEEMKEEIAK